MFKFLSILLLVMLACTGTYAQDSLFVREHEDKWAIQHMVRTGETIFILARRYHVPPAVLADMNKLNYQSGLEKGDTIYIPVGAYNLNNSVTSNDARKLYYRVRDEHNLGALGRITRVSQTMLQQWNNLPDNDVHPGQVVQVGWFLYDSSAVPVYNSMSPMKPQPPAPGKYKVKDSIVRIPIPKVDTVPPVQRLYLTQTSDEQIVMEESGMAVFFANKEKPNSSKTIFAFHNTVPKGRVIKVYNPGTGMTVYVKVIGPVPETKQYHNAVIGIGGAAKRALGVTDDKAWCELKYAPY